MLASPLKRLTIHVSEGRRRAANEPIEKQGQIKHGHGILRQPVPLFDTYDYRPGGLQEP